MTNILSLTFFNFIFLILPLTSFAFNAHPEQECAGLPRVNGYELGLENKCLGLAFTSEDIPWGKPRRIIFKDERTILVSDMGSFAAEERNIGAVWEIDIITKDYKKLYSGGNWTHGLAIDSKGRILIGDSDKILRINNNSEIQTIIDNLPSYGSHPLSHFILLENDDLILNIGGSSNDCSEEILATGQCLERDKTGNLRVYKLQDDGSSYKAPTYYFENNLDENGNTIPTNFFARGLRNSMALVYNPILKEIYQVENNIDAPGTHEELNTIPFREDLMYDYGWPFCKENNIVTDTNSNRFRSFCNGSRPIKPTFLIPPHSAPLDMMYYNEGEHPELQQSILMTWHGWRRSSDEGLVLYKVNPDGSPTINQVNENSVFKRSQPYLSLISGSSFNNSQPKFTPVGLTSDGKGKVWIVDDKNKAVLVYASSNEIEEDIVDEEELNRLKAVEDFMNNISDESFNEFSFIYSNLLSTNQCMTCHGNKEMPLDPKLALNTFLINKWLSFGDPLVNSTLLNRLSKASAKAMPPLPSSAFELDYPAIFNNLKEWANENLN